MAVFREFCRLDLGRERVPDATTLLNFRHLLETHELGAARFAKVGELLLANGMKLHIGADSRIGLVHSASVTAANVHDSHQVSNLLHGEETRFYDDSAYRNAPLTDADREINRRKSSLRSKVEHPFLTLKRLWGFAKVRYRGLAKNANRAFAMLAMVNLVKWGRHLTGEVRPA